MSLPSVQSLKRAIADGGFTIISALSVDAEVRAGTLAALPLAGLDLRRALRAVRRARGPHRPSARAFWAWLAPAGASVGGAVPASRHPRRQLS